MFVKKWYEMRYGSAEELEDYDFDDVTPSSIPSKYRSKLPRSARKRGSLGSKRLGRTKSGRGASGHTFKFK